MEKDRLIERVRQIAAAAADKNGVELVHVEIAGTKRDSVVRIYIDKKGGVTLEDCSTVSRDVEEVMDEMDIVPGRYVLEVSSPGIERELYSIADFEKFNGELIKIKAKAAVDGQKTFVGTLTGTDGQLVTIEERKNGTMSFDYGDIEKANLKIDLSKEFKGR